MNGWPKTLEALLAAVRELEQAQAAAVEKFTPWTPHSPGSISGFLGWIPDRDRTRFGGTGLIRPGPHGSEPDLSNLTLHQARAEVTDIIAKAREEQPLPSLVTAR